MNSEYKKANPAAVYAWILPAVRNVAREHGYAIGLHGTMARDLDLIAVPWVDNASPAEALVEAVMKAVGGQFAPVDLGFDRNPAHRPHGRRAWSIYFAGLMFYIDLSIMPLAAGAHERLPAKEGAEATGAESEAHTSDKPATVNFEPGCCPRDGDPCERAGDGTRCCDQPNS